MPVGLFHELTGKAECQHELTTTEKKFLKKLAICHVILGGVSIILAGIAVGISVSNSVHSFGFTFVSAGIWCGVVFLAAGFTTAMITTDRPTCFLSGGWWMSVVATLFACTMFSLELATASTFSSQNCCQSQQVSLVLLHALMAGIGCCEIVVAVITSAYCCRMHCCLSSLFRPKVTYISGSDAVPFANNIESANPSAASLTEEHNNSVEHNFDTS